MENKQHLQQFLRFKLEPDLHGAIELISRSSLAETRITELINIRIDLVVPMPHLSSAVVGVYNWRGEILWVVDFATLLGLNLQRSIDRSCHLKPTIVLTNQVARGEKTSIGLIVGKIDEIEWHQTELIQSYSPDLALSSWLKGYWKIINDLDLLLFDGRSIFKQIMTDEQSTNT